MNPWIWAIGAVVVALLELHAPGCYLIWVALGGAVTAIAAFTAVPGLTGQLVQRAQHVVGAGRQLRLPRLARGVDDAARLVDRGLCGRHVVELQRHRRLEIALLVGLGGELESVDVHGHRI